MANLNHNLLLGAVAGDIIGSHYEFAPTKRKDFTINWRDCRFTDDSVMTIATAEWLLTGNDLVATMLRWGRKYPHIGYGKIFLRWLYHDNPQPYGSWGNGSAMRVSPVGWAFDTLEATLAHAKISAEVSHNHPRAIAGAQATAACIFMARTGQSKEEIRQYVESTFGYDLHRTCDDVRPNYRFDTSCQGSVPESIIAFLDSTSYEDAIRLAISLGGDADTMAAIAGSIAEAYYGLIPQAIIDGTKAKLPAEAQAVLEQFYQKFMADK
ncbi:MAG: ADP-ribosylglycohydrolase family protein [Sodaliphilus sp.]|nr:ADP-ribosylglycohydrolase family protein [Sodaliphilus sp.]